MNRMQREIAALTAFLALLAFVGITAPSFFRFANLVDLVLANTPVLIVAVGMTMVIIAGQIDISIGSQFAICSVAAGWFAKSGLPMAAVLVLVPLLGGALGAVNGALIGALRMPAIVVTLAAMVVWRDALRWLTEGAWVQELPPGFQWFGFSQSGGQWIIVTGGAIILAAFAWILRNVNAGRAVFAAGSDSEAARLAGIDPARVVFRVFVLMGALTGIAAVLNAVRFNSVPGNPGQGLELKSIAAVVVGGAAISGGRATLTGTLIGTALLGTIGTALTFAGINPFWEKAIQGAIILFALLSDVVLDKVKKRRMQAGAAVAA